MDWYSIPVPDLALGAAAELVARLPFVPAEAQWIESLRRPVLMDTAKARRVLRWRPRHDAAETLQGWSDAARSERPDPLSTAGRHCGGRTSSRPLVPGTTGWTSGWQIVVSGLAMRAVSGLVGRRDEQMARSVGQGPPPCAASESSPSSSAETVWPGSTCTTGTTLDAGGQPAEVAVARAPRRHVTSAGRSRTSPRDTRSACT